MEIKLNKSNNNPFYGLRNCLNLLNAGANGRVEYTQLDNCWEEVKGNKEHREMFFSLLFSIGDITARQHNIFKGLKRIQVEMLIEKHFTLYSYGLRIEIKSNSLNS